MFPTGVCCSKCGWCPSLPPFPLKPPSKSPSKKAKQPHATIKMSRILRRMEQGERLSDGQRVYLALCGRDVPDVCDYCETPLDDTNRTLDHVIPKAKGGTDALANMCLCCYRCNCLKGDTDADVFRAWLARSGVLELTPPAGETP